MRSGGNPDGNQAPIVAALRKCGVSVKIITHVGEGCPDLLCGFRRRTFLLEVKTEDGELDDSQVKWHREWRGLPVDVVRSPVEALQAVGAMRRAG